VICPGERACQGPLVRLLISANAQEPTEVRRSASPPYGGRAEFRPLRAGDVMKSIDDHIQKDQVEIEAAKAEGNLGKVRHLEEELKGLKEYKEHHPEDSHDPSPLEVYCDLNPEAPECRVYDD
jgi:hypothetical protein